MTALACMILAVSVMQSGPRECVNTQHDPDHSDAEASSWLSAKITPLSHAVTAARRSPASQDAAVVVCIAPASAGTQPGRRGIASSSVRLSGASAAAPRAPRAAVHSGPHVQRAAFVRDGAVALSRAVPACIADRHSSHLSPIAPRSVGVIADMRTSAPPARCLPITARMVPALLQTHAATTGHASAAHASRQFAERLSSSGISAFAGYAARGFASTSRSPIRSPRRSTISSRSRAAAPTSLPTCNSRTSYATRGREIACRARWLAAPDGTQGVVGSLGHVPRSTCVQTHTHAREMKIRLCYRPVAA